MVLPDTPQTPALAAALPAEDCKRILPAAPQQPDAMIHHMLKGALSLLKTGKPVEAANLLEAVAQTPTRNRWIYHALANFHLALLHARGGEPRVELLERALTDNCMFPDALATALKHAPAMAEKVIRQATGLAGLNAPDFLTIMQCGVWKDINLFRDSDDFYRGKRVLDFGARTGFHALAFFAAGAAAYVGVDHVEKAFQLKRVKNHLLPDHPMTDVGFSMEELAAQFPERIQVTRKFRPKYEAGFDLIALFSVSEHLNHFAEVMRSLGKILSPRGEMLVSHHNFHSWNGHHSEPKSVSQLEHMQLEGTPAPMADWHFFEAEITAARLNRLPLSAVRALLAAHFEITQWQHEYSSLDQGLERFSPQCLREHPECEATELLTQRVLIRLRRKRPAWLRWLLPGRV